MALYVTAPGETTTMFWKRRHTLESIIADADASRESYDW